jgi:hypothetical protein
MLLQIYCGYKFWNTQILKATSHLTVYRPNKLSVRRYHQTPPSVVSGPQCGFHVSSYWSCNFRFYQIFFNDNSLLTTLFQRQTSYTPIPLSSYVIPESRTHLFQSTCCLSTFPALSCLSGGSHLPLRSADRHQNTHNNLEFLWS